MLAAARLLEIEERLGEYIQSITPLELDGETLRLILHLKGDTHLRVTEREFQNLNCSNPLGLDCQIQAYCPEIRWIWQSSESSMG